MPPTAGSSTGSEITLDLGAPEVLAAFYFDVRSPEAYLAAERILTTLPFAAEWTPVRSLSLAAPVTDFDRASIEARAASYALQPLRWPAALPDDDLALRAATYAKGIGRAVAFALAAFRQAFAGARDLSLPDNVLIAGSACEMHPTATLKAVETQGVRRALEAATVLAAQRGVRDVPAIWLPDGRVFHGEGALADAAAG